jgi:hypothetical protein
MFRKNMKKETATSKFRLLKIAGIIGVFLLTAVVALVLFIKLDTAAAAEFTDNFLRPLLGPDLVISMEKVFYNISDKIQQATYHQNTQGLQFIDQTDTATIAGGKLNLTPIPVEHGFTPQPGEGTWHNHALTLFPQKEVMAYTYVRPDGDRPYAYVTLVQMDANAFHLSAVAGTAQPGGPVGKPGPGKVPAELVQSGNLVAAFDGGFQYRDGQYGMIVGDTTYLPLENDLGTLVGYKDGSLKIMNYTGQSLGKDVEFVRQNCPILIEDGQISILNEKNKKLWGRTLTSGIFTWRSGFGITKEGNLVYAVGNNLTPLSLSYALKMAGAVNAIQLDINPYWVRFNIFDKNGAGTYKVSTLTKDIHDGSKQYLGGYSKDFFYLYKKPE